MRDLDHIPAPHRQQVLTVHVSPALRTIVAHLPLALEVHFWLPAAGRLPEAVAGLLKATLTCERLVLAGVEEAQEASVEVRSAECGLRLSGGELDGGLEGALQRVLTGVVQEEGMRHTLVRLAVIATTASTLQTLTTHMLATYDLDKALHMTLSGITAGWCLAFNRAIIFRHDADASCLVGHAAIGPASAEEAHRVWEDIEADSSGLESVIGLYSRARLESPLQHFARQITIPLTGGDDEIADALSDDAPTAFIDAAMRNPQLARLQTNGTFVLAPVRAHQRLLGLVFADDLYLPHGIDPVRVQQLGYFIDQTALIWENLELLQQQREFARRDPLTGALNRRELRTRLEAAVDHASRTGTPLALLMIDVDQFKEVNDRRGHAEGDRILQGVVAAALSVTGADDFVARYGGDEFVVILHGASPNDARVAAEWIGERVRQRLNVTISIGAASAGPDVRTSAALFEVADRRMYEAKQAGRDRFVD